MRMQVYRINNLVDWKSHYSQDANSQIDLQIQNIRYENSRRSFVKIVKLILKCVW